MVVLAAQEVAPLVQGAQEVVLAAQVQLVVQEAAAHLDQRDLPDRPKHSECHSLAVAELHFHQQKQSGHHLLQVEQILFHLATERLFYQPRQHFEFDYLVQQLPDWAQQ